ncbi:head completion/stabilization protein [Pelagerythrobacter sp.]|uniref:head completion/stabilization protein n=1 Tax=Pelagerythrobacter sp. TaxID=2800702 RepID=UPI0035B15E26
MAGLIAPPDNADPADAVVFADGWFPDIPLALVRDRFRLGDNVVTTPRLVSAIEGAMISAFRALALWRAERIVAGAATFDLVTLARLNDRNMAEVLWERIIGNFAAAELADTHRDVSATDDGLDRAEEKSETADDYRRLAYHAIADLQSLGGEPAPRNRVALV